MEKRILLLRPGSLMMLRLHEGSVLVERIWDSIADTVPESFFLFLSANDEHVYSLVVDLPTEESHVEFVPSVRFSDRRHLVNRLQQKYFAKALLASAISIGQPGWFSPRRNHHNASGDASVIAGISQDKLLSAVLEMIDRSGVLLKAIHSPLTLINQLCTSLGKNKGAHLLVFGSADYGCRLVACVDGRVLFSRQADIDCEDHEALLHSVNETLVYLSRQEIPAWSKPSVSLAGLRRNSCVEENVVSQSGLISEIEYLLVPEEVPDKARVSSLSPVHLKLCKAALNSDAGYARKQHRHSFIKHRLRSISIAAALSALAGALSTTAIANKLELQYQVFSDGYVQALTGSGDRFDVYHGQYEYSVEAVRQALITARIIDMQSQQTPMEFYTELAAVVGREPSISINTVSWHQKDALDELSLSAILDKPDSVDKLPLNQLFDATLGGIVEGNAGSALGRFENFVSELRETSTRPSVIVVDAPFGLGNESKTSADDLSADRASFVIELTHEDPAQ